MEDERKGMDNFPGLKNKAGIIPAFNCNVYKY